MLSFDEFDEIIQLMEDTALVLDVINEMGTKEERRHWRALLKGAMRRVGTELCEYVEMHCAMGEIQKEIHGKSAN